MTEAEKAMMKSQKKVGRLMSLCMGFINGTVMAAIGMGMSGHFTVAGLFISLAVASVVMILLSCFISLKKVSEKATEKFNATPGTLKHRIIAGAATSLVMCPVMTLVMTSLMVSNGIKQSTAAIEKLDGQITELTQQYDAKNSELEELIEKNLELKEDKVSLESHYEELNSEYEELKLQLEDVKPEDKAQINELKGKISGMEESLDEMTASIADMEKGLENQETGITALTNATEEMKSGIDSMTAAKNNIKVPNLLTEIIKNEIVLNIVGVILNAIIHTPVLNFCVKMGTKRKKLV